MSIELDFSILDKIPSAAPEDNAPFMETKKYYKLEAEEKLKASMEEIFAAHQKAIVESGQLTNEITKGIQAGEKLEILLLKAIKCISIITGNELFYALNKSDIQKIYGVGISENSPGMETISDEELNEFLDNSLSEIPEKP